MATTWGRAVGPTIVGLGALACALLGIEMTRQAGNIASLWIANAVLVAALVTQPRERWSALILAFVTGNAMANLLEGDSILVSLAFGLVNAMEGVAAALVFARLSSAAPDFERIPQLLAFGLAAGIVGPLGAATLGSGLVALAFGAPYLAVWPTWFLADSLGNLTLGPLLILLIRARDPRLRDDVTALPRLASSVLLVAAACAVVFFQRSYPLAFLLVPAAVVATHRAGPIGAALSVMVIAAAGGSATVIGWGPMALAEGDALGRIHVFQLLLVTLLACTLPLAALLAERRALMSRLRAAALRDELTGLTNRAGLMAALGQALARAGADDRGGLSLLLFDIDHFKAVNDAHGHLVGDHVLEQVAGTLRDALRPSDLPARMGGEEFVVLLPRTTLAEAHLIGERLRRAVEGRSGGPRALPRVTVSAGAAEATWREGAESLLARADRALYAAKSAGRNRVELAA